MEDSTEIKDILTATNRAALITGFVFGIAVALLVWGVLALMR